MKMLVILYLLAVATQRVMCADDIDIVNTLMATVQQQANVISDLQSRLTTLETWKNNNPSTYPGKWILISI